MKIKVSIDDVTVEVDRPAFKDYGNLSVHGQEFRINVMKDTIIPSLEFAVNKAKELYAAKLAELQKMKTDKSEA